MYLISEMFFTSTLYSTNCIIICITCKAQFWKGSLSSEYKHQNSAQYCFSFEIDSYFFYLFISNRYLHVAHPQHQTKIMQKYKQLRFVYWHIVTIQYNIIITQQPDPYNWQWQKIAPINQLLKVATVKQPYLNKLKNSRFPQKKKKKKKLKTYPIHSA